MPDTETVIKGLEAVSHSLYFEEAVKPDDFTMLLAAIDLLKEQEPVKPHWRCPTVYMNGTGKIELMCGNCGINIPLGKPSYCPWCGRAVKWE